MAVYSVDSTFNEFEGKGNKREEKGRRGTEIKRLKKEKENK